MIVGKPIWIISSPVPSGPSRRATWGISEWSWWRRWRWRRQVNWLWIYRPAGGETGEQVSQTYTDYGVVSLYGPPIINNIQSRHLSYAVRPEQSITTSSTASLVSGMLMVLLRTSAPRIIEQFLGNPALVLMNCWTMEAFPTVASPITTTFALKTFDISISLCVFCVFNCLSLWHKHYLESR